MTLKKLFLLFAIFPFVLFTQYGCEYIDGAARVNSVDEKAERANEEIVKIKKKLEEIEKKAAEEAARRTELEDGIEWGIWLVGAITLILLVLSPVRNIILRIIFKTSSYKPRRFDKDKE